MKNQNKQNHAQSFRKDELQRVVTLTLPEKTLQLLETIDQDLTQAIVKLADIATQRAFPKGSSFEIVKVAPRKSVFIVGSDTQLARIPWLKLVEVAPGRNLITIPSGISLEDLEVAVLELADAVAPDASMERKLLNEFRKYVGRLRRYNRMSKAEIIIVDTDE